MSASGSTRRDLLRGLLGAGATAALATACGDGDGAAPRLRVGIVGGGMAGVATAWLLDGAHDVTLFEARSDLGGNVRAVEVEVGGQRVVVDVGAQYFSPGPYPTYVRLLAALGLYTPDAPATDPSYAATASITISGAGEPMPRFVSPITPERLWALNESWNGPGLSAFLTCVTQGRRLELSDGDYGLTLDDWLRSLDLTDDQRQRVLVPWVSALISGQAAQGRQMSARAALSFVTLALRGSPLDPIRYHTLTPGMGEALRRMVAATRGLTVRSGAAVEAIGRDGAAYTIVAGATRATVDVLVLAVPGYAAAALLADVRGTDARRSALAGVEYFDARIALHRDPAFAPADPRHRSYFNVVADGDNCEASISLAHALRPLPDGTPVDLWKSWVTHRAMPREVVHAAGFRHMLPTPATIAAQSSLRALQGDGRIYVVGGYTRPYDAQETALLSALEVARGLGVDSAHARALEAPAA